MSGRLTIRDEVPFADALTMNQVAGVQPVLKYGKAESVGSGDVPFDVWSPAEESQVYEYPAWGGSDMWVASTNATDTTQHVQLGGLDAFGNAKFEVVQLNGQTPVKLENKFYRVFRGKNANAIPFLGTVNVAKAADFTNGVPDTLSDLQAEIPAAGQQTQMTHVTIPKGYYGVLTMINVGIKNDQTQLRGLDIELYEREFGGVFLSKGTFPLNTGGTSYIHLAYEDGRQFKELSDIKLVVTAATAASMGVFAEYAVRLYELAKINPVSVFIPT